MYFFTVSLICGVNLFTGSDFTVNGKFYVRTISSSIHFSCSVYLFMVFFFNPDNINYFFQVHSAICCLTNTTVPGMTFLHSTRLMGVRVSSTG